MSAKVHGWCGYVEKSSHAVCLLMVLNKMWIPDVLIDIIKDHLFISREEVLRKFYKQYINRSIIGMSTTNQMFVDMYGRDRLVVWQTGYIYGGGDLKLQGSVCVTCGDCSQLHGNMNGCCALMWDSVDEPIHLEEAFVEPIEELMQQLQIEDVIPEVTWETDIPNPEAAVSQFLFTDPEHAKIVRTALAAAREEAAFQAAREEAAFQDLHNVWSREQEYNDYDREAEMADYAEYMEEVRMERMQR
jgi:hypothetical protein